MNTLFYFQLWNSIGIIKQYSGEDSSIEVEFHDTSIHHPLRFNNESGFTMAALSNNILVFASEASGDKQR